MGLTNVGHGCTTPQLGLDAILKLLFLSQGLATPTRLGIAPQVRGTSSTPPIWQRFLKVLVLKSQAAPRKGCVSSINHPEPDVESSARETAEAMRPSV